MLLPMAREQDMISSFQRDFLQLRGAELPAWHPQHCLQCSMSPWCGRGYCLCYEDAVFGWSKGGGFFSSRLEKSYSGTE